MEDDAPGPKARPALVKRASADQDGNPWVHVAYGTSQDLNRYGPENFVVSNVGEMDACGLYCATRFNLDRVALIPWCDEYFADAPSRSSPWMGKLSEHGIALLKYQAGRLTKKQQAAAIASAEPPLPFKRS